MSFAARFASATPEELTCLARKYDALADLRDRREQGAGVAPRAELRALAREFPGALRELDTLPRAEIERRRASLREALLGDAPAPWMTWMVAYHATMRAALFVKARLARARDVPTDRAASALPRETARAIAEDAARHSALPIDEAFVQAVARPPARRVNAAVFERLGRELGVPADEMWQALFPTRRASRFSVKG
ncbi:MAG TPA: hypothetical protein VK550_24890 [Polyangiaceae bacterium]|nr:hypothetical protein [Polyangiaceae bacterium]